MILDKVGQPGSSRHPWIPDSLRQWPSDSHQWGRPERDRCPVQIAFRYQAYLISPVVTSSVVYELRYLWEQTGFLSFCKVYFAK